MALKRQLGVSYPTAWLLHHKILQVMSQRKTERQLDGTVQLDDAYLGGDDRSGGSTGRGTEGKPPFIAAVSVSEGGHPRYLKLVVLSGFTSQTFREWACKSPVPGTLVSSDALACFGAVVDAQCLQEPSVVGRAKPREMPQFQWVNTVLGNLKRTFAGAHHSFKFHKSSFQGAVQAAVSKTLGAAARSRGERSYGAASALLS